MKIKIYEDRSYSRENFSNEGTENENLATTLYFQFPETVNGVQTSTLNKYIVFDINGEPNTDILTSNNSYSIPTAITQLGTVSFNIYLVAPTNNGEDSPFRWISKKITLNFNDANDMTEIVITVEEINIFNSLLSELNDAIANIELLEEDFEEFKGDYDDLKKDFEDLNSDFLILNQNYQAAIQQVENVNIDANKINDTATVTITNKDGIQKEVTIKDGIDYEITSEDYQEIANIVEQDITPLIPTKVSQLENDSAYIKKEVNNLTNYYKKDETYTKEEVDNKVASVYKYKGTVATYADLPSLNLTIGDVYNVESDGSNYAWTGTDWDKLGGNIDLSGYQEKIDNSHKLNADLVDDTSTTHKFVTASDKSNWNNKVDKVTGKGLSTEDYTTAEKTKLAGIETGAEANDIDVVKLNGTALTITNKEVNIPVDADFDDTSTNPIQNKKVRRLEKLVEDNMLTDSGEAKEVVLEKTAEYDFKELTPKGNSEQASTTGKQMFTNTIYNDIDNNNSAVLQANGYYLVTFAAHRTLSNFIFEENTRYTISLMGYNSNSGNGGKIGFNYTDNTSDFFTINATSPTKFTLTSANGKTVQSIAITWGSFNTSCIKDLQLEEGPIATSYEPFTGNSPAPSPSYPFPIKNVTGNNNVVVNSKNLFDNSEMEIGKSWHGGTNANRARFYLEFDVGTQYTISMSDFSNISSVAIVETSSIIQSTGGVAKYTQVETQPFSFTHTFTDEAKYLDIQFESSSTFTQEIANAIKLQLELGSTATDYVPYQKQTKPFTLATGQKMMLGDYLADDGIHHIRKQATVSGTSATFNNAKNNGAYLCTQKTAGNLSGKTITFDTSVTDAIVEYELDDSALSSNIEAYTTEQQTQWNNIKKATSYEGTTIITSTYDSANAQMILKAEAYQSTKLVKEDTTNKVNEITAQSTNTQYPGAKVVYDELKSLKDELEPIPVILDTDFWTDVDDAVAIRELIWAEREGICDIVGLIVDAVNSNSAKAMARYLDYEGRGDLPFALEKNATDYGGTPSYFNSIISSWNTGIYTSNDDAPDENEGEYYMKLLQSLPEDKKCKIICVGYLSALAGLFNRAVQNQQVMNLVLNKIEKIFIMGGTYPNGSENNFNRNSRAKQAAYDVCTKCPSDIPIVFLGYEVGESVKSGGTTGTAIGTFDLLYKCMVAHGEGANGRSSWDPMTVLLALADNENQSGYVYTRGTNVVNVSTGANAFTENNTGSHYYVTKKYDDAWYSTFINSICERKGWKFRKTGKLTYTNCETFGFYTFDGTEDWQFNTSNEPNTYGFYNCYLLGTIPESINSQAAHDAEYDIYFKKATVSDTYFNRLATESCGSTTEGGFNLFGTDPSIFFRFDSTIATSVAGFKTYLTNNPITLKYKKKAV